MTHHTRSRGRTDRKRLNRSLEVPDELPVELKVGLNHDLTVFREFHRVIKLAWHQRKVSQRWRDAVIKVLLKKKDETECGNYHGISLVAHADVVLLKIIATRLSAYCETEEQCGFRPHRWTTDMVFAVRRPQGLRRKARVPLFQRFIDLQKEYDSVDRTLIWRELARFGVPPQMIEVITNFTMG